MGWSVAAAAAAAAVVFTGSVALADGEPHAAKNLKQTPVQKGMSQQDIQEYKLARQITTRQIKQAYDFVIIGAGTTAYAAIETILRNNPDADILVLVNEIPLPHPDVRTRPPLSSTLRHSYNEWRRHITDKLEVDPDSSQPMTVLLTQDHMKLDLDRQRVVFDDGSHINYDKCLIATAGRPRGIWAVDRSKMSDLLRERVNMCSTIQDFYALDNVHEMLANKQLAIVGGGFLATELALSLSVKGRQTGMHVSQIFAEEAPLARFIPSYLAHHVQRLLHGAGVRCIGERLVTDVEEHNKDGAGALRMSLMGWNKESLDTDYAVLVAWNGVAWLGPVSPTAADPSVDLASKSGLEIDPHNGGIVVNQQLEAVGNVFCAGGLASYYDSALGRRRVEMFDHSINSGMLAGHNMSADDPGGRRRYLHQPMFRSNMKDIDVMAAAVGEINSRMRTVGVWVNTRKDQHHELDYQRGIVYYLDEQNMIKGVLLWNAGENVERARDLLRQQPMISNVDALKHQVALAPDSWLTVVETERQTRA